jgi:hypothetical protein
MASRAIRGAAVLHVALGLGFGIGAIWTMRHFGEHGELPMTPWGFRSMAGPFNSLPAAPFTVLGWGLAATCAVDVLAGTWLWQGRRRGAFAGLATNLVGLVLGSGFALPFLLAGIPIRAALVLAGRSALR